MNKPAPWTEIIGTVESVTDGEITLVCRRRIALKVDDVALARWIPLLQLGRSVAILMLDDGTVRVRRLDSEGR